MYPNNEEFVTLKSVYDVIRSSPGFDFRDVQARAKLDIKATRSAINTLLDKGIIEERQDEESLRYFPSNLSEHDKTVMGFLRQFADKQIIMYVLEHPECRTNDLAREVHIPSGALSWHLKRLSDAGVVELKRSGLGTAVSIKDPNGIMKLLITYKESFLDKLVNKFIETWTEK